MTHPFESRAQLIEMANLSGYADEDAITAPVAASLGTWSASFAQAAYEEDGPGDLAGARLTTDSASNTIDLADIGGMSDGWTAAFRYRLDATSDLGTIWRWNVGGSTYVLYVTSSTRIAIYDGGHHMTDLELALGAMSIVAVRATGTTLDVFVDGVKAASSYATAVGDTIASDSYAYNHHDHTIGAVTLVTHTAGALSDADVATLSTYLETWDPAYAGGGVSRPVRVSGVEDATDIELWDVPHPARARVDFADLVAASLGGTAFDFNCFNGATEIEYRFWFDVDGGSTAPAADGRTLVAVSIATGDTPSDCASALASAAAVSGCSGSVSGEACSLTSADVGMTSTPPADVGSGLAIEELAAGGTNLELIESVSSTSGGEWSVSILVGRPRSILASLWHAQYLLIHDLADVNTAGASLSISQYLDPAVPEAA